MPTSDLLDIPPGLERNAVRSAAEALNSILADSYALYLKTKNFHWHVSGPHFRDYHLMLDEQAAQILGMTDAIAERVRKTGGTTLRSIGHIARLQRIEDNDADHVSAKDMLTELHRDNLTLVGVLREAKELADAADENATSALLDDWTAQAEGRAWFLLETSRRE
jgi:starvation-inducible DNA-binding protein